MNRETGSFLFPNIIHLFHILRNNKRHVTDILNLVVDNLIYA